MACDVRIFDERARVALPECTLGMQPGYGGTQRLPRLVGPGFAKKMMYTGLPITAQEALRAGLADELAPAGGSLDAALELAQTIAGGRPSRWPRSKKALPAPWSTAWRRACALRTAESRCCAERATSRRARRRLWRNARPYSATAEALHRRCKGYTFYTVFPKEIHKAGKTGGISGKSVGMAFAIVTTVESAAKRRHT